MLCHDLGITPARIEEWPEDLLCELEAALKSRQYQGG